MGLLIQSISNTYNKTVKLNDCSKHKKQTSVANMKSILIRNIQYLVQTGSINSSVDNDNHVRKGEALQELPLCSDAYLLIEREKIQAFGSMAQCPERADQIIDARGGSVFPAWCDSHTHIVYAGDRVTEYVDKIRGLSYQEIAQKGGGILNSAQRLANTDEETLYQAALNRLKEQISFGTGAIEIKSGYGLSVAAELKMLRVIRRLKETTPVTIKATFLGAHAIPLAYQNQRANYIRLIIEEMLPQIADEGLADYCDVFCDKGFFTPEETDTILKAALQYNLVPKIHANELGYSGGVQVGVVNHARSVDHLEYVGEDEIAALLASNTMPTLLPSTAFFLRFPYAPAREMIDAGLPIALATDYNPGSSPSGNMPFVLSLACTYMRLLPEEAINAATINGAYAMDVLSDLGSISVGKKANVFITRPISSVGFIPYAFGSNLITTTILNGQVSYSHTQHFNF